MILWDLQRLRREIDRLTERVEALEAIVNRITPVYTDMPKGGGADDLREKYIMLKDKLSAKREEYEYMAVSAEMAIADVKDPLISSILSYKYIDGYSWRKVARKVGGGNTADSVRMAARRYIKRHFKTFM